MLWEAVTRKPSVEAGILQNAICCKMKSILINDWVTANYSVSRPPFVRHLGFCNRICAKLLQLMCAVSTHNYWKKRSLHTNQCLSYSQLLCFRAAILSAILEFVIGFVSNLYNWCALSLRTIQWKNKVFILLNCWVTANYSVSRPPFCSPSWNL